MFTAVVFKVIKNWNQAIDKWINKLWYIYTIEYYSARKKKSFPELKDMAEF